MTSETTTVQTLPEAPVSATVKVAWRGYDVLYTTRGHTGADVLTALDKALTWFEGHGGKPGGYAGTNGHAAPAAAQNGGGAEGQAAATDCNRIKVNVAEPDGKIKVEFWRDGTDPPRKYAEESVSWSADRVTALLSPIGLTADPKNHAGFPVRVHYTIGRERPPKADGSAGGRYHDVTRLELLPPM